MKMRTFLVIFLSIKRFIGRLIIFIGNKLMKVLVDQISVGNKD